MDSRVEGLFWEEVIQLEAICHIFFLENELEHNLHKFHPTCILAYYSPTVVLQTLQKPNLNRNPKLKT